VLSITIVYHEDEEISSSDINSNCHDYQSMDGVEQGRRSMEQHVKEL